MLHKPNALIGSVLLFLVGTLAFVALFYTPYDPLAFHYDHRLVGPSVKFWFGTDEFGRDILSRMLAALAVSLYVSLLTVLVAMSAGTLVGAASGYIGGWFDRMVMTVMDAFMALPGVLLALGIMAAIGSDKYSVVLALAIAYTPNVVRVVRGTVFSIREKEFIEASRALGNSELYSILRHVLPNCVSPLTVIGTSLFGAALLAESALSFLGVGVPPPSPTLGGMLASGREFISSAPWLTIFPGLGISLTLLGVNMFGDALRDKFDPRMNNVMN